MSETLGEKLTALTAVLTFGVGTLTLLLGQPWWWMVFVVGWFILTPSFAVLFDTDSGSDAFEGALDEHIEQQMVDALEADGDADDGVADRQDALDLLRERYAAGELDEVEFERKVERLLETESIEDAEALLGEEGGDGDREPDRDLA